MHSVVGGTDNGRQKTRNHLVVASLWAEGYLLITPITLTATCHTKPKTQINRRRTRTIAFPFGGMLPQAAWPERLLSEKSGRCGIAAN